MGIILILAHNWDDFSRSVKTIFAFLPLVIGQLIIGYSILKKKGKIWKESSGVFLFFAVGSSIALVSQIYNMPGDISSYLLTWIILCLPLVYLLKSQALAVLHIVFTTYYACVSGYFYGISHDTPWWYLVLLIAVLPYYGILLKHHFRSSITSVINWLIPLSVIILMGTFVNNNDTYGYLMYVLLFGLFYNIGKVPRVNKQKLRKNGYLVLGFLGTIYMLILSSFNWFWKDLLNDISDFNSQELYMSLILFFTSLGLLVYSYINKWLVEVNLFQYVFILFSLIFFIGMNNSGISTILINLLVLMLGVMAMKIGSEKLHLGILNYGLLIITILIACRFFDTNISFVFRGLLFVGLGVGFFFANYAMMKR